MKRFILLFLSVSLCLFGYAQAGYQSNTKQTVASPDSNAKYRLFQTNNRWTFLKLNTSNGVITHVQYSTDGKSMEYSLNPTPLVVDELAKPGRFFLYPTENTYNFLLLDQEDGRVWQVQWNIDADKRGIWRIY